MFFSHADLVSHPTIEVTSSPNISDFRIQEFGIKNKKGTYGSESNKVWYGILKFKTLVLTE